MSDSLISVLAVAVVCIVSIITNFWVIIQDRQYRKEVERLEHKMAKRQRDE